MSMTRNSDEQMHTMKVPMWMWLRAQKRWGCENPASQLRDILAEWFANDGTKGGYQKPAAVTASAEVNYPPWKNKEEAAVVEPKEVLSYWSSDTRLQDDLERAREEFLKHVNEFWTDEYIPPSNSAVQKDAEEVEGFLEDIEGMEYDDLTEGQQAFLGVIRKAHRNWWKANNRK